MTDKERWEARYSATNRIHSSEPSSFLREQVDHLPHKGLALDIAAGEGRNSIFLAERGLEVIALDISETALQKCVSLSRQIGVEISAAVVDLTKFTIPKATFDVIINFNYLQRDIAPQIVEGLKPGGVLVFETMTTEQLRWKPDFNPEFLLHPGELIRLFEGLQLVEYREATIASGSSFRSVASLVARKPFKL